MQNLNEVRDFGFFIPEMPKPERHHVISKGQKPDFYRREDLRDVGEGKTDRGVVFDQIIVGLYLLRKQPIPYAFRTPDGLVRSLDAGCIKMLLNRKPPELELHVDTNGFIDSVEPTQKLIDRYRPIHARLTKRIADLSEAKSEILRQTSTAAKKNSIKPISFEGVPTSEAVFSIAARLNKSALTHPFGDLQDVRRELGKIKERRRKIFSARSVKSTYALHMGGQGELQFNIGIDVPQAENQLRYGVAFSFEPSQGFHETRTLIPKLERFNQFIQQNPTAVDELEVWSAEGEVWTKGFGSISSADDLVKRKAFVFFGKFMSLSAFDPEVVLSTFLTLLPLYRFVESPSEDMGKLAPIVGWDFESGGSPNEKRRAFIIPTHEFESNDLHGKILAKLQEQLIAKYGGENVRIEHKDGRGGSIDGVRRSGVGFWFYEVKACSSARACIREAVGQLLEYALYPPLKKAVERLIVVGYPALDKLASDYIDLINARFPIQVEYLQISLD